MQILKNITFYVYKIIVQDERNCACYDEYLLILIKLKICFKICGYMVYIYVYI